MKAPKTKYSNTSPTQRRKSEKTNKEMKSCSHMTAPMMEYGKSKSKK